MNIRTLAHTIDRFCEAGNWAEAKTLIQANINRLITPTTRNLLSSESRDFLKLVVNELQNNKQESSTEKIQHTYIIEKRKNNKIEDNKVQSIIRTINEHTREMNWRRVKFVINENYNIISKEPYRSQLDKESLIILDSMERAGEITN